jgi:hypothetical protein
MLDGLQEIKEQTHFEQLAQLPSSLFGLYRDKTIPPATLLGLSYLHTMLNM